MRKLIPLTLMATLSASLLAQQNMQTAFTPITFNNSTTNGNDKGIDVGIDGAGNVYVLGSTETSTEGINYIIRKYDNNGSFQYTRQINSTGSQNDIPVAMAVDTAGNVYVTGSVDSGGTKVAFLTAKLDPAGNVLYDVEYNLNQAAPGNADQANDITCDTSGNAYVVGESFNGATGNRDYVVQRYSGNTGTISWTVTKNGPGNGTDRGRGIIWKNGFLYFTGELFVSATDKDFGTGKLNPGSGTSVWFNQWTAQLANDNASAYDVDVSATGNVCVVGERRVDTNQNKGMTGTAIWFTPVGTILAPKPEFEGNSQIYNYGNNNQDTRTVKVSMGKTPFQTMDAAFIMTDGVVNTLNNNPQISVNFSLATDTLIQNGGGRAWDGAKGLGSADDVVADGIAAGFGLGTGVYDFDESNGFDGFDIMVFRAGGGTVQDGFFNYHGGFGNDQGGGIALDANHDVWVVGSQTAANGKFDIVLLKLHQRPAILFDEYHTFKNQALTVNAAQGVLWNDSGTKGATVVHDTETMPQGTGTVTLAADGSFTYTPVNNFTGDDGFYYKVFKQPWGTVSPDFFGVMTVRVYVHPNITGLNMVAEATGGTTAMGTVSLDGNSPGGGYLPGTATCNPVGVVTFPYGWSASGGTNEGFVSGNVQGVATDTNVTITVSRGGTSASDTMLVKPGGILSVTVNPTTVIGGENATGTVTLAVPAAADKPINLSTNSAFVSVPAQVTIPMGQTSANFAISTSAVTSDTTRQIIAKDTDNISSKQGNITLKPNPALTGLSLNPTSVHGGQNAQGTVTLSTGAIPGGTQVMITDNSSAINTPPSVIVAAGQTQGTFAFGTTQVQAAVTRTVTASLNAVTKNANIAIHPSPTLTNLTPANQSVVGGTNATATVTLSAAPTQASGVSVGMTDNSSAINVPPSVVVTTGSASKQFSIPTSAVGSAATRTVTATLLGVQKTINITVNPSPVLTNFTMNPTTVKGGNNVVGTVTLSVVGGGIVNMTDNTSAITPPPTVTVPAGSTSANFNIATSAVASTSTRTVTASRNGVSITKNLTLTP